MIFHNEKFIYFTRKEKNTPEALEKTVQKFLFDNHFIKQQEVYHDFGFLRSL